MPPPPVQLRKNARVEEAEKRLMPIMKRRTSVQTADPHRPWTHLKAGSSVAPEDRYKPGDRYRIPQENIVAVTKGHSKSVEEALINNLRKLNVCDNANHDRGQKPPFANMDGKVYYYMAEKN